MTTKMRWLVATAVVTGVISFSVGFAAAGGEGSRGVAGGMMGGTSGGMMGSGMVSMMNGVDMEAMHQQMMAAMAGTVPSDMLARCNELHGQMRSASGATAADAGHASHHVTAGSTG
ncbi:MAG: hypothetical protein WD096_09560 [Actinomycetota bacterium]